MMNKFLHYSRNLEGIKLNMDEQKRIKKQLIKNMLYIFVVFTIVLLFFDLMVYNKVASSVYDSVDKELMQQANQYKEFRKNRNEDKPLIKPNSNQENMPEEKDFKNLDEKIINPRIIYVERSEDGTITNESSIGRIYENYLANIDFDKSNIENMYMVTVNNYAYRGINISTENSQNEIVYIQLLTNVDGENAILQNLITTIILGTIIVVGIAVLASYVLSKRALKPIIISWKKQTEFVQNAAHELRTPLTIIQAKTEMLLQEPNKKIIDKSEDITISLNETRRLSKLIKELMSLARADSDEMVLKKENIDIDKLIKEISIPYIDFAKMENKKIEINTNFKKNVNIDKSKINQLMVILLDNAVKYTTNKDIIKINTYEKDGKCYLEVVDTGIGMSKDGIKHAFDRFYREDKARNSQTGGNGLGLSIAYSIVNAHKGSIKILQNQPKGIKVVVKI